MREVIITIMVVTDDGYYIVTSSQSDNGLKVLNASHATVYSSLTGTL